MARAESAPAAVAPTILGVGSSATSAAAAAPPSIVEILTGEQSRSPKVNGSDQAEARQRANGSPAGTSAPANEPAWVGNAPARGSTSEAPATAAKQPMLETPAPFPTLVSTSTALDQIHEAMPSDAAPGLLGAVAYATAVFGGRRRRGSTVRALTREMRVEQRRLDEVLLELGRQSRAQADNSGAAPEALAAVDAIEKQREEIERGAEELSSRLSAAQQHFTTVETDCNRRRDELTEELRKLVGELRDKQNQLSLLKGRLAQDEKHLKTLEHERDTRRAQATRTADPAEQEAYERLAAESALAIADHTKRKEATVAEIERLNEPIESLRQAANSKRQLLRETDSELRSAKDTLATAKRDIAGEKRRNRAALYRTDRELADKLTELGRAIAAEPSLAEKQPEIAARITAHRAELSTREQRIEALQSERSAFDRGTYRRGLVVAGVLLTCGALFLTALVAWMI